VWGDYLTAYAVAAIVFFGIDFIWLKWVANTFYRQQIGHLMADTVNLPIAAGFYLIFLIGLVIFGIAPYVAQGDWGQAALYGGLYGFFAYTTYDMTNLATLRNFPAKVAIVDTSWGTAISALTAAASVYITHAILR
jgi:uncharacterized membrane protein